MIQAIELLDYFLQECTFWYYHKHSVENNFPTNQNNIRETSLRVFLKTTHKNKTDTTISATISFKNTSEENTSVRNEEVHDVIIPLEHLLKYYLLKRKLIIS